MKKDTEKDLLDNDFIKKCARAFAYDLLRYSEHGGDMTNLTAAKVYKYLEELDEEKGQGSIPN